MANDSSTRILPIPPRYDGLPNAETFGRLISRPDRIDPTAKNFFAAWIAAFPAALEIVSGNGQSAPVDTQVPAPLVVKVIDSQRHPVAGARVIFQVRELDARIDGRIAIAAISGPDGTATAPHWRLGGVAGAQHVDVSVDGAHATFSAEATSPAYTGSTPRPPSPSKPSGPRTS